MGENQDLSKVEVTYSLGDLFAINYRAWRTYLKLLIIIELIFVGLILIFPLLDGLSFLRALQVADWWFPLIMGVVLLAFWFGVCPFIGYWRSKRRGVLGPNHFSLSARGIEVLAPNAESLVYWSAIKKVMRTKERIYLFMTPASALIMPRRAFATDESFDGWAAHSQELWSKAKSAP